MKKRANLWTAIVCGMLLCAAIPAAAQEEQIHLEISSELIYEDSLELAYARQFSVDYYEGGYALVTIAGGRLLFGCAGGKGNAE